MLILDGYTQVCTILIRKNGNIFYMLLSELCRLTASPSMAGGMLLHMHVGAGSFSVWWQNNKRSCRVLVRSVPLKPPLLGQFLTYQTSKTFRHCCVKKLGKSGQKNAIVSRRLPGETAVPSDILWITVLLSHKARKCSTVPQTGSFQILWGHHTALFSHSIKCWVIASGVTALFYVDKSYCKWLLEIFFSSLKTT